MWASLRSLLLAVALAGIAAPAQSPPAEVSTAAAAPSAAERIRALMEASVEKQRQSLNRSFASSLETQRRAVAVQQETARRQYQTTLDRQAPAFRNAATGFFQVPFPTAPRFEVPPIVFPQCAPVAPETLRGITEREAERNGLDTALLWAVMRKESAFNPCAVSSKGALGLMQLMPTTALELEVADPFDPSQNVAGGARYLRSLLNRYQGNLALALGAYNAGPSRVDEAGGIPPIPETRNYVNWILRALALPSLAPAPVD